MNFLMVLFLYFIYCMIGWVWETTYESIRGKKFVNRGFLNGPYIPIYGFGGVAILLFLQRFEAPLLSFRTVQIYFAGTIGATIMEYVTSYVLEKVLKARWWDYSDYRFNLNGRICLIASIFWGVVAVAAIDIINPFLQGFYAGLSHDAVLIFVSVMSTLFVVDIAVTVNSILDLQNRLQLLLVLEKDRVSEAFGDRFKGLEKYRERLTAIGNPFTKRILTSFPNMKFTSETVQTVFNKLKKLRRKDKGDN